MSRDGGLLVVLDDLHWADADSLALLELVGRSLIDRPIAVVGTFRDTEAGAALQRLARTAEVLTLLRTAGVGHRAADANTGRTPR